MIRTFRPDDTRSVVELWETAGLTRPWNDPYQEIDLKLAVDDGLFLVAEDEGRIIGTAMGGYDGHRGWIYSVAVVPDHRGRGIGTGLVSELEARLAAMGCVKVNLQVRTDNTEVIDFYHHLGYGDDHVIGLGKRLMP